MTLRFGELEIPGLVLVEPQLHRDERGFFFETYHAEKYRAGGIAASFVQDNCSRSQRGTLRGLHAQHPDPQGRLLRVVEGEIFDVAVEARRGAPHFGRHVHVVLSAENRHQLYLPPGLLHGFVVTSEVAQVEYKCTAHHRPEADFAVAWDDPDLAIPWPVDTPLLSPRDAAAPRLREIGEERLVEYAGPVR